MASKDYVDGFAAAVDALGQEGDYRHEDWSKPYKFIKGLLTVMQDEQTLKERVGTEDEQLADILAQLRDGSDENKLRADTLAKRLGFSGPL